MTSFDVTMQTGPGHAVAPPSCTDPSYAAWVDHHQLDEAALTRLRDRRRLARALRQAKRLQVRRDRAWARVRGAERRLQDATC